MSESRFCKRGISLTSSWNETATFAMTDWNDCAQFPILAPVAVRNDDGRWVYYHPKHDKEIETPCEDLEDSMFWYYLTEMLEVDAEEDQLDENVTDFVAVRIPADELR